jgi:ATP-dependent Clp protease ATP-binding subunit ClpC
VGKTELARTLAEFLFDEEESIIRIDMSEYMEKFAVSRLVGAPPGYVGFEEGGQLTEAVRRKPYAVVLLDEVEKAHPDVFNMLLQVLEDGRLTDSQGRRVDFKNTVLIMTSNIGLSSLSEGKDIGFRQESKADTISREQKYDRMKKKVLEDVKKVFKPEFINRLDEIIVFQTLDLEEMKKIVGLMVKRVTREVETAGFSLEASDAAKAMLAEEGFDPQYGARPLRRAIQRLIEDPLAEEFIRNKPEEGATIFVDVKELDEPHEKDKECKKQELTFTVRPPEKKPEPPAEKPEKAEKAEKADKADKAEKADKADDAEEKKEE